MGCTKTGGGPLAVVCGPAGPWPIEYMCVSG